MCFNLECIKCKVVILASDGILCPKCARDLQDNVIELDLTEINKR